MKETLYNFLSSCNDSFWWSLKFGKDTALWSLKSGKDAALWSLKSSKDVALWSLKSGKDAALWSLKSSKDTALWSLKSSKDVALWSLKSSKDVALWSLKSSKDVALWSLKSSKDAVLWSLITTKNSAYWFATISSNGVVYGAKMILHMLTYSNELFFYYMKYLWRNASKDTLYYVCLWFKDNWRYITSPEVRSYVIQGLKDWVIRERNGFINALDGPYGIHTFMMFAFLSLMIGLTITSILNPDFFTVKEEEIDLFARFSMDPDVLIAQERALDAQQEHELQHRMFHDPDFNPLEHPRLRREYIQERLAILRARELAKSPLSDLYQP